MRHKCFHFCGILCKEHLHSAHQYIGESTHSTILVPSQLKRHKPILQRTLKEMEKTNVKYVLDKYIGTYVRLSIEEL